MRALGPGEAVPHVNWPRVARPGKRQQPFWAACGQVLALQRGSFSVTGLFYCSFELETRITGWREVSKPALPLPLYLFILGADRRSLMLPAPSHCVCGGQFAHG